MFTGRIRGLEVALETLSREERSIKQTLARLDPDHAAEYGANHRSFLGDLDAVDAKVAEALAPLIYDELQSLARRRALSLPEEVARYLLDRVLDTPANRIEHFRTPVRELFSD